MSFLNEVRVNRNDLEHVVRLAALIDDQAPEEHTALVRVAAQLDNSFNRGTRTNIAARQGEVASVLLKEVRGPIPKAIHERWKRQIARYHDACEMLRRERAGTAYDAKELNDDLIAARQAGAPSGAVVTDDDKETAW